MAIGDYVYLLKPESGDTTAHNELDAGQTLSNGSAPSLVDLGGGQYVWRFSGATFSGATDSRSMVTGTPGTGVTIAIKMAVTTSRSAGDDRILVYGDTADAFSAVSAQLRRGATSSLAYVAWRNGSGGTITFGTPMSIGTAMQTIVIKVAPGVGATDYISSWWSGGGAGPGADDAQTSATDFSSVVFDTLSIHTESVATYDVERVAIWHEELSDADCDSIRDDFDAALSLGGGGGSSTTPLIGGLTHGILTKGRLVA